jgi:hypothetical protein
VRVVTAAQALPHPFQAHQLHTLGAVVAVFMLQQHKPLVLEGQVVVEQVEALQERLQVLLGQQILAAAVVAVLVMEGLAVKAVLA